MCIVHYRCEAARGKTDPERAIEKDQLGSFSSSLPFNVFEMLERHSNIFTLVDPLMTRSAERDLLTVDFGHHFLFFFFLHVNTCKK